MADPKPLRLLAQDDEDIAVISAATQDAVLRVGDIAFEPAAKQLTLLLNRFRNVLRQKRPVTFSSLPGAEREGVQSLLENFPDTGNRPDQATELLERAAFLRECIRKLPEKQRDVVYLRFYVDHSLESIALALGCSLGTVKSRLFHALDRLRAMNELNSRVGQLDHNL